MFKAVVTDLDGTLLNSNHKVSTYTKEVIHKIKEMGITVMIATGRHHIDALHYKNLLDLDSILITSNGATVHDEKDHSLFSHNIDVDLVKKILDIEVDDDVYRNLYIGDLWYNEKFHEEAESFHKESGFLPIKSDFNTLDLKETIKIFYLSENHDKISSLKNFITKNFGDSLSITLSLPHCLEIMAKDVHKGNAVKEVLEKLDISPSETLAFGDGFNDFEMLSFVGKGLLMGNCNYLLSEALPNHEIIKTNDENGVASYLDDLFLKS